VNNSNIPVNNFQSKVSRDLINWRRSKVLDYLSKGFTQDEIADILKVSQPTIQRDIKFIRTHSKKHLRTFISERLPEEVDKAFTSFDSIIKRAWQTADSTEDDKVRLQALNLVKETFAAKMDLCSNVDIVNHVIGLARDQSVTKNVATEQEEEQEQEQEQEDASGE
jgi:DNA-binding transcriptional regulator LsrR (DeoR family)